MSHTTTTEARVVIGFAISALCIAPMTVLVEQEANGQLMTAGEGVTYTSEDLVNGKADHLKEIQYFEITSGSMFPLFEVGEMAAMNYSVPFESIQEGDVIVFDSPAGHVSHRVIDIDTFEDGSRIMTTLGDNNDGISIPGIDTDITEERYIGKVIITEEA